MKVQNLKLLEISKSWSDEDKSALQERLAKTETDIMQVYKLFQIHKLVAEFFPENLSEYNNLVRDYQNDNSENLYDVMNSYRIAEYKAFKEILQKAGK